VIEKIAFLVRLWELMARHTTTGDSLSGTESIELLSLMQLVTDDLHMPEPGSCARPADAVPAHLIGQGVIVAAEVRYVCAAALLAASAKGMTRGSQVVARIADEVRDIEYVLPCSVEWVHDGKPSIMALVVDGIPTSTEYSSPPEAIEGGGIGGGWQVRTFGG
jgi:hypothetical protein